MTNIPAPGIDPPDRIELRGLRALGIHGVLPEERERPQPFEVDLDLEVDLLPAGRSDDLADTVDYGAVAEAVVAAVAGPHVDLLETLAERIASAAVGAASGATGTSATGPAVGAVGERPGTGPATVTGLDRDRTDPSASAGLDPISSARLRVLSSPRPAVTAVTVAVRKLRPPVGVDLGTAGVRIHRYADQLAGSPGASAPVGDR